MKLHYYYDKEADVFYISQGKPSSKDRSEEAPDDTILRLDAKTGKIKGFTIVNFTRRLGKEGTSVSLPIEAELSPARK